MLRKTIFLAFLLLLTCLSTHAQEPIITDVAWNADGTLLAIGWDDINAPLEVRNVVTGESHFYDIGLTPNGYSVSMRLAWNPTIPNRIAVFNLSSPVYVFTVEEEELQFEYGLISYGNNKRIDWNADGTLIAIIGSNECCALNHDGIQIWDAQTGEMITERISVSPYTLAVDWHPDNPDLLVYTTFENGWGAATTQWNVAEDTVVWTTGYGEGGTDDVAWKPDGTMIGGIGSTIYSDIRIHLYDRITGEITSTFGQRIGYYPSEILWLDNNHILVHTGILEIWNIETQQLVYQIENIRYMFDWHPVSGLAYVNAEDDIIVIAPEDIPGIV